MFEMHISDIISQYNTHTITSAVSIIINSGKHHSTVVFHETKQEIPRFFAELRLCHVVHIGLYLVERAGCSALYLELFKAHGNVLFPYVVRGDVRS